MRKLDRTTPAEAGAAREYQRIPGEVFKEFFAGAVNSVHVITFGSPRSPWGFTASSVCSLSASPPMLAFNVGLLSSVVEPLRDCDALVVNALSDEQESDARIFAGDRTRRFTAGASISYTGSGEFPYLTDSPAYVVGRVKEHLECGDHLLVITEIVEACLRSETGRWRPLLYHNRAYLPASSRNRRTA